MRYTFKFTGDLDKTYFEGEPISMDDHRLVIQHDDGSLTNIQFGNVQYWYENSSVDSNVSS